jgi:catechol 2,3-dioxygenase-like lactoylglutathione lyase family enzyme
VNQIDHVTVGAADLARGVDFIRGTLGIEMLRGGKHPDMGTHNCVMRTVEGQFLELLSIDPDAPAPSRKRWFGLDGPDLRRRISLRPAPVGWVVRTSDLGAVVARSGVDLGPVSEMSRGSLSWRLTVPAEGVTAFDGLAPHFIEWNGSVHPSAGMAASGIRLEQIVLTHPQSDALAEFFKTVEISHLARIEPGETPSMKLIFRLADGKLREL